MRDQQGFTDFASARAGDLRRQAYLLTGSPERAVRLADKALAETGRRWDRLGGVVAAEEHARRVVAVGSLRGRGGPPAIALTARGTAAPIDDEGEAVRRALAGLPPRRRAVLVLRYDEGLDDAAVGARLGLPPATAAAEGEAGLVTLRSLLRRRGRPEDLLPTALADTPLPTPVAPAGDSAVASSGGPAADRDPLAVAAAGEGSTSSVSIISPSSGLTSADAGASDADARPAGPAPAPAEAGDPGSAKAGGAGPAEDTGAESRSADGAGSRPAAGTGSAKAAAAGSAEAAAAGSAEAGGAGSAKATAAGSAEADGAASAKAGSAGSANAGGAGSATTDGAGSATTDGAGSATTDGAGSAKAGGAGSRDAGGAGSSKAGRAGSAAAGGAGSAEVGGAGSAKTGVDAKASGRRRGWLVAAVVIVVLGIGAALLVPALRGDSAPDDPVPAASGSGPGQLAWPVRGPLAGDQELLRSALRAWQSGVPDRQRPVRAAALWAGDLDGVRTVVLQGTDATGQSWVAQIIGSGDTASLRSAEPLGRVAPLLAIGTSAGAVRLLADPDAAPNSILAGVGRSLRPLAVAHDSLTQGITAPPAGLRVALTDGGAVVGSGTVLPGRLSPVTGTVELTRPTLDLGPAQPPVQAWYDDGELIARRLGGPVELVQAGPVRAASVRVNGRSTRLESRAYEVVRSGTRYLATVIRAGGAPACTDTATVGPVGAATKPVALVVRCIPRGSADGVLAAVGTRGIRSAVVTLAPAAPAMPGRPGAPPRPARPARTVTVTGTSGSGLVGLTAVPGLPTAAAPAVARDARNHRLARLTLPAYHGPRS